MNCEDMSNPNDSLNWKNKEQTNGENKFPVSNIPISQTEKRKEEGQ